MVTVVRLAGRVDHMMLVQAGVLGETFITARHCAHVRLLPCMDPHVIFVVGGAGKGTTAAGLGAVVWPLARVRPNVHLPDV